MKIIEKRPILEAQNFNAFQALKDIEEKMNEYLSIIYDVSQFTSILAESFSSKNTHTSIKKCIEQHYPNILKKCKDSGINYRFGDLPSKVAGKTWGKFLDVEE